MKQGPKWSFWVLRNRESILLAQRTDKPQFLSVLPKHLFTDDDTLFGGPRCSHRKVASVCTNVQVRQCSVELSTNISTGTKTCPPKSARITYGHAQDVMALLVQNPCWSEIYTGRPRFDFGSSKTPVHHEFLHIHVKRIQTLLFFDYGIVLHGPSEKFPFRHVRIN